MCLKPYDRISLACTILLKILKTYRLASGSFDLLRIVRANTALRYTVEREYPSEYLYVSILDDRTVRV